MIIQFNPSLKLHEEIRSGKLKIRHAQGGALKQHSEHNSTAKATSGGGIRNNKKTRRTLPLLRLSGLGGCPVHGGRVDLGSAIERRGLGTNTFELSPFFFSVCDEPRKVFVRAVSEKYPQSTRQAVHTRFFVLPHTDVPGTL